MNVDMREWKMDDAPHLAAALNNKKIQNNLRDGLPYPYTTADAKQFIEATLLADKTKQFAWAITVDDAAVGSIGVFRKVNVHSRTAEMGYYIAEPYWGKGIATKVIQKASRYIFDNTDIVRIFAEPYAHSVASCRALEKCGFLLEGTLRNNAIKNGTLLHMNMYALLKEDLGAGT